MDKFNELQVTPDELENAGSPYELRWDCMYQFANIVTTNLEDIIKDINHVGMEGDHTTLSLWKE